MAEQNPIPANEQQRLEALRSYDILDTAPEAVYDAITRLASYICQVPMAAITLIDSDRQWLKSKIGFDITETPRAEAFCRYTILDDVILEVPDTREDAKFANSDYVTPIDGIRFYAGAPLIDESGYRLGSLCVIDNKPRKLTDEQRDALQTLSVEVISHLTLRKQKAELELTVLRHQEFFNLFNNSPDIHCIINASADVDIANEAFGVILKHQLDEVIGKPFLDFLTFDSDDLRIFKRHFDAQKSFELETRVKTGAGETKWINWCVSSKNNKWYVSGRDITYQKQILANLQELSIVASKISNGVAIMNADNKAIWINDAFMRLTGYTIDDIRGRQFQELLQGDYHDDLIRQKTDDLVRSQKSFEIELQIKHKNGHSLWVSVTSSVVFDEAGNIEKYIKVLSDITARKQAEQELNILTFAARKSPGGIIIRDRETRVLWMNESFEKITGYTLEEMKGKAFGTKLIGEESNHELFAKAVEAVKNNQPYELEIKIYRKDGKPFWAAMSNSPIFNEDGQADRQVGVMTDVTERKLAEQQLKMLSLVASNTTSGVVINDAEGNVEWVNNAFYDITGYTIDDVRSQHLGDVIKGELTDAHIIEKARELSRNKQSFEVDILVYRKDGQPLWISVINSVILGSDGRVEKYIEVIIDITAKKKAELELIAAKEEALQLGRAKEMFISVMSHEIRTPLNAVIGMSRLLLEDNPLPSQQENLSVLKFSAENLMMLINDVLDFTKIETGNIQLEKTNVDLRELVQSVAASMRFKAQEKNIYIKCNIDEAVPLLILGDSIRLVQILLNLVGNAIKFTDKGGVSIDLKVIEQNADAVRIRFGVADTGIGIAPEKVNTIFELWKQAETDTTRKYGGTGLGLAISKRLVTLHDSRINVDSVVGHGSTFWFTISFSKPLDNLSGTQKSVEAGLKINILVVDDNQINRLLINKVLKKWGADADFAENGAEAVDMIKANQSYDVVLMDIHMPVMGGLEATRVLRGIQESYFQQLPIIALTASMLNNQMNEIGGAGMNDYVLKPFDPKTLYDKLARYQRQ